MAYRFRLSGNGLRHHWWKECRATDATRHAAQVAREYAKDGLYHGTVVRVMDDNGNEIDLIPVSKPKA